MSDRQFVVLRTEGFAGPFTIGHVDNIAAQRIRRGDGPFRRRVNGKDVGHAQLRKTTLDSVHSELLRGKVGDVMTVRKRGGDIVLRVREAVPAIRQLETNGNDKADRYWSGVKNAWPKCSFLGAFVCKEIVGSTTLSQHSYGNAVDVGAASMNDLGQIAEWAVRRKDTYDLQNVIVGARIWSRDQGWHTYTGDYHYHVHADFFPTLSGPCGVRAG